MRNYDLYLKDILAAINSIEELPDYDKLSKAESIDEVLAQRQA